jgi:hypothetical protein
MVFTQKAEAGTGRKQSSQRGRHSAAHLFVCARPLALPWCFQAADIADQVVRCPNAYGGETYWLEHGPKTTLCSAAVASPATASLACACGLALFAEDEDA